MRILHTADWHLGRSLEGRSRQEEQEQFIDELCGIVAQEQVHLVMLSGDIFDTFNPPAAAEELYCDALARLADGGRRAVAVIAGNHDSPDRLCAVRALAQRLGIALFGYPTDDPSASVAASGRVRRVASGPGWVEVAVPGVDHSAVVLALPYPSESRLNEVLQATLAESDLQRAYSDRVASHLAGLARNFRPDAVRLVMSHIFMAGGAETESERPIQVGGAYTVSPTAMPAGAQYVGLGHLHRPQRMHLAPAYTRYAGSPLAYSFSEAGYAKSVTVLDATPAMAEAEVREIVLSAGRPLVRWKAAEGLAQVARWVDDGKDANAWIDLEVTVPRALTMDEIQTLRKMHPGFIHIHPVFTDDEVAAASEDAAPPTLQEQFERFYRSRKGGGAPSEELTRLFLELVNAPEDGEVEL
jgi:exonuclease SbcD